MHKRSTLIAAAAGLTIAAAALAIPASAANTAPAPGCVVVLPGTTRVVPVPGRAVAAGATTTVQVTGTGAGQADPGATGVVVKVTGYLPSGNGALVVHPAGTGAPGNDTVAFTRGSENSATTFVGLNTAGQLAVTDTGAATRLLLEVDSEIVPCGAGTPGPVGPAGPKGDTGPAGKDAAILDGNHTVDSADLAHIGGPFAANHTVLTTDQGNSNITLAGSGQELVNVNITFCRDGAQAGSPDAVPNVVVKDTTAGTTLASLYGPALLGSNSQVNCGIESTVSGSLVATGGDVLELDGFAYDANQGSAGTVKVDYGSVTPVTLGS